ncbi:MAG TPA: CsgG/HfaB family protein [Marinospirillum sp.]|uniref:CsgG/HfaB family protein n=1 Tax=Marinospirillum sp. TaxID=2183934 RepID=UPI002B47951C|nr:CsgG/HfaB family protein [Marinospirillum sp.]HKM15512.1 CsgG/HfaB family protein [Marinospirillum sp.]
MKKTFAFIAALTLAGCATQTPPMKDADVKVTESQQREAQLKAQQQTEKESLRLKRKIAVGRLSNETNYGRSLLRENAQDQLGGKVTDMFLQALTNSNRFLVFERPDLVLLKNEAELSGQTLDIVGVDTLVIGSLTQFGRATTGERGFLSSSKKQQASATVDLRLVDVTTGRAFESVTGSGIASTEHARTMGFGSAASYDGSLNDQAIAAAVTAAVDKMTRLFMEKPWTADILGQEGELLFISGGKSQGVQTGMVFDIETKGHKVKSQTTGATITLPGKKIGELKVISLFGEDILNQGAAASLTKGSVVGYELNQLQIKEQK